MSNKSHNSNSKKEIEHLYQIFREYGGNAQKWIRKCELLLPEIERKKVWKKKGFTSIYEFAAKLAGMSKHKVDDSLRILKKIEDFIKRNAEVKWIGPAGCRIAKANDILDKLIASVS